MCQSNNAAKLAATSKTKCSLTSRLPENVLHFCVKILSKDFKDFVTITYFYN